MKETFSILILKHAFGLGVERGKIRCRPTIDLRPSSFFRVASAFFISSSVVHYVRDHRGFLFYSNDIVGFF